MGGRGVHRNHTMKEPVQQQTAPGTSENNARSQAAAGHAVSNVRHGGGGFWRGWLSRVLLAHDAHSGDDFLDAAPPALHDRHTESSHQLAGAVPGTSHDIPTHTHTHKGDT